MPIVSSAVVEDAVQRDGRRAVRERHTDHLGQMYDVAYLAEAGADVSVRLTPRAAQIAADLTVREIAANVQAAINQGVPPLTFNHSTAAQALAAVRTFYATLTAWDAIRIGNYVNGLGLSNAQYTAVFGVSGAALTALKAKVAAAATKYADVIAEQGQ